MKLVIKGRIRKGNKILSTYYNNKGYECASLYYNLKTHHPTIHRLVAQYFINNPNGYNQVNHKDCNKGNNRKENLEWCNQRYNYNEGMKHFLYSHNENHYFAKLKNSDVMMIPKLYRLGFTRATISKILGIIPSSVEAIEKGISYRKLGVDFRKIKITKYKDRANILLPSDVSFYFKDNTVLNTLIAQGKVSV